MSLLSHQTTCKFFVDRKKRYCKMLVKSGQEFCGEHQKPSSNLQTSENSLGIRIVCPLDPKHTVFTQNLKKHLKICNAREKPQEEFIEKNVNSGHSEVAPEFPSIDSFQMLSTFSKEQILNVIKKVDHIYEEKVTITTKDFSFKIVEDEINKPENGNKAKKHLKQASSILGLLQEYNLLKNKTCFIEFGAGRGQLSYWIAEATDSLDSCKVLVIEKASPKHKRDNKLAKTCDKIMRIRADIADLVLDKIEGVNEAEHVVGATKHLCGGATDLAIRCLTSPNINKHKIKGMILTFCCHHRCLWTSYTGKKFFEENHLDITDFQVVCGLTSWAICGTGFSREYRKKLGNEGLEGALMETEKYGLSRTQREEIGRKCKNIINWGRLKYLQEFGFECLLHYYVNKEVTLENVCIVAQKVPRIFYQSKLSSTMCGQDSTKRTYKIPSEVRVLLAVVKYKRFSIYFRAMLITFHTVGFIYSVIGKCRIYDGLGQFNNGVVKFVNCFSDFLLFSLTFMSIKKMSKITLFTDLIAFATSKNVLRPQDECPVLIMLIWLLRLVIVVPIAINIYFLWYLIGWNMYQYYLIRDLQYWLHNLLMVMYVFFILRLRQCFRNLNYYLKDASESFLTSKTISGSLNSIARFPVKTSDYLNNLKAIDRIFNHLCDFVDKMNYKAKSIVTIMVLCIIGNVFYDCTILIEFGFKPKVIQGIETTPFIFSTHFLLISISSAQIALAAYIGEALQEAGQKLTGTCYYVIGKLPLQVKTEIDALIEKQLRFVLEVSQSRQVCARAGGFFCMNWSILGAIASTVLGVGIM
ncbi:uncharacterized protein [Euwallacea similis]|uniref:uncharacterized protein n=1 Tax=Euwallacea similis TaxID=1736056 RepID=UPI00344B7681